jgi:uncharacterized protein YdeI (YjbR/CyaY-like superfamily)
MPAITSPDDYFSRGCGRCDRFATAQCASQVWQEGLQVLRQLCLDAGLAEVLKWSHPCYTHAGRNIAILGAFRGDFRITFINPALLDDPQGLLERAGPNTQHPGMMRFKEAAKVRRHADAIRGLLHLGAAKKSQTRIDRLARLRGHILAGKGALEPLDPPKGR